MSIQEFSELMGEIARSISDHAVDQDLANHLNAAFPKDGKTFQRIAALCVEGERDGWLMRHEAGGIKFGRALKPDQEAGAFSVDVVRMKDVKGPHHVHPKGEIGAIFPIDGAAKFDGFSQGWYVYPPGSDHHPTVTEGDAYVLYLLPEGAIEFTGR
ncbi:MAG: DUF4863 family protein [Rhodobacteraceae bacterium]|nr:DUF4863 family protein [Paracoccaceae bacterium]